MLVRNKNIIVPGKHIRPILTDVFYTQNQVKKPIIVFCHGYKGFKDWGAWDLVAEHYANAGFFFVKFNFSHNGGTIEQPIDFPDLEAFGKNTYLKELDDLETVLNWLTSENFDFKNEIDVSKIITIGHSRGGGIVAIKAAEDNRVTKLITWAGVSDYKSRFPTGEAFEKWRKNNVYFVENGRTKQQMPHYFEFYTSYMENEERLTISKAVQKLKIPYLIVHGTADPTVTVAEAEKLHFWNPRSELFLVGNANHVFGAKHPWNDKHLPGDLRVTLEKSTQFALF